MIIAEYTLDHPVLRETLERVPGIEVMWEDSYTSPDGQMRMLAWIDCEDVNVLKSVIADDLTVANPLELTKVGGRRLYRFDLIGEGAESSIMPVLVEGGGVQLRIVGTRDGWRNRTRFPSREAFERVYRFCSDHGIDFEFHRIYERSELFGPETPQLSDAQLATLIEAVDSGYLDIPRQSSLRELGERLGVSESATSERFRRGVKRLIQQTVYPDAKQETR